MKKLLFLFAVLLTSVGAWAQQQFGLVSKPSITLNDATEIDVNKYYILQTADEWNMNLFLKDEGQMRVDNQLKVYDATVQKYLWQIIKDEDTDTYSFKNVATGKFFPVLKHNNIPTTVEEGSAGKFTLIDQSSTAAGVWNIKNNGDDVCLNVSGSYGFTSANTVGWNTQGGNSNYKIYVAETTDLSALSQYDITFKYYEGEILLDTKVVTHYSGRNLSISDVPALDFFTMTFKEGDHIVVEDAVLDINCTPNFPFEPATINASGHVEGKWYKLTQGGYKIAYTYNGNGQERTGSDDDTHRVDFVDDNSNAKGYWAFVRVPGTIKFNIYNLGRPGVPMAVVKHAGQRNKENYNWGMLYIDYKEGSITDFVISKNDNFFNIQIPAERINNNYATCGDHIGANDIDGRHFGFWSDGGSAPITASNSRLAVEEVSVDELDIAISNAKTDFKKVLWGDEFPYANSSYDGTYINSFEDLDVVLEAATSVDDLNATKREVLDNLHYYYIRMYNAGRYKERNQKWYVSGSKVVENGNENSLFVYNTLNKTLKQVSTGNFLIHGTKLEGQGEEFCYSIAEDIQSASAFHFTPSTIEGLTDAWSVYDEFGYMTDWGNTNNVFSIGTPANNWATWAVEIVTQPVTGKFYILKGSNGKYLTIDGANTGSTTLQTSTDKGTNTIFYLEPGSEDTKFYLVSYQNGNYVANPFRNGVGTATIPSNNGSTEIYKQEWNLVDAPEKQYKLFYAGQYYMGVNGDATNGDANGEGEAYCWSLVPVKVLPFTFNAEARGYATFHAPVAVQLPDGVNAYIGEIVEGNKLQMRKFEEGKIPANTAVLLYNSDYANTPEVSLSIIESTGYTQDVLEDINDKDDFVGTVAAEDLNGEKDCYSLQKSAATEGESAGKMGFFKKISGTKGGFKAWLEITKSASNARAFTIIFDGDDATGLKEALGLENENVEIYDLSGRRLDKPAKGVNVIGGKLVIK